MTLPSSKPEYPETLPLEMTYQFYAARRDFELKKVPAMIRPSVNFYFDWLRRIQPIDVINAIELGKTAEEARKEASMATRLGVATAKGILKASKKLQQQFKEIANPELALMTLQFENPETYKVIESYGERGTTFIAEWLQEAMNMLGVC